MNNPELNKIIHQPVRTKIIAYLINVDEAEYNEIKRNFSLSDGHMTTHMRKLLESKYISMHKEFVKNRPRTTYKITALGREEFRKYLDQLKALLEI